MKKTLFDLTKDDWNTLFPVELVDHDPNWKSIFEAEKHLIFNANGSDRILRIEHFGSSSIPNIKAKPYIDLLIEIPENLLFDEELIEQFKELGYTHFKVPAREGIDAYMSFGKGYNLDGVKEQIFHIHMCPKTNVMWEQIQFRDYLIQHQDRAKAYEALKMELASKYRNDRGAYVLGKTEFIQQTLKIITLNNQK
ncbi:GrpB family protein [Allomuricauda sp. M10]|uniref:GrpB family protein n=1 Tax=Allomuricauda sp. M10 TaxID=2683292 RepID=UPI001D17FFCA|nr:GrpB family protein [Muricauda sp. M10]